MTEEIIVTPWSSDSEWQLVRQDIYASKDVRNYNRALRKLLLWKTRGKPLTRGLYCTELILQVITKDDYFCNVDDNLNENDLIHLYSMAIMKFVNLTADVLGKGPQKSMYVRASRLELPSWLIDMRHKISHDQDLPTLKSLRTAMEFALEWLQTKYWNEDENFLIIVQQFNMNITDEFIDLLEFFMFSKTQSNTVIKEERLNYLKKKFSLPDFSNKECIKRIKELLANKLWSSQLINVLVTRYLLQTQKCNIFKNRISNIDKEVWSVILKILNSLGLLTYLLQRLVTHCSHTAALWVIELCIVVYRNNKKIKIAQNKRNDCLYCKPSNLNSNLILRTALSSPHKYTGVFLKWLLRIQSNSLKVKQQYSIVKLVSLYTDSVKINSKNSEQIFTVNDLINKYKSQHQSHWSLALGEMNWKQIPFGTIL